MADVFISYSKHDRVIAEALGADLRARGFDVWWDYELYAGEDFHDLIRAEIGKAMATVVIWSEHAVVSKWVRGEAQEADDVNRLISSHAPGFDVRKVPINFRTLHCEPVANRAKIIAAIERKGAKPRTAPDPIADVRARGEAAAQVDLGLKYERGLDGLTRDESEAERLYKLAVQGDAEALANLGNLYERGVGGLRQDKGEALRLYELAAKQGNEYTISELQRLTKNQ